MMSAISAGGAGRRPFQPQAFGVRRVGRGPRPRGARGGLRHSDGALSPCAPPPASTSFRFRPCRSRPWDRLAGRSAQPVQRSSTMPCRCLGEPAMASVGQTRMHQAQPSSHARGCVRRRRALLRPYSGSSGTTGRPVAAARRRCPPHRRRASVDAAPSSRMARAYARHPSQPHWRHCVCGSRSSISSSVVMGLAGEWLLTKGIPREAGPACPDAAIRCRGPS